MRRSTDSPNDSPVRYLDLETAAALVEAARDAAQAAGRPSRVPPLPLSRCDEAILRSALAAPSASFEGHETYPDMPSKAAAMLYSLAKSQACLDGNKRLALIAVLGFLRVNGYDVGFGNREIADTIETTADSDPGERTARVDELTEWFRAGLRRPL